MVDKKWWINNKNLSANPRCVGVQYPNDFLRLQDSEPIVFFSTFRGTWTGTKQDQRGIAQGIHINLTLVEAILNLTEMSGGIRSGMEQCN